MNNFCIKQLQTQWLQLLNDTPRRRKGVRRSLDADLSVIALVPLSELQVHIKPAQIVGVLRPGRDTLHSVKIEDTDFFRLGFVALREGSAWRISNSRSMPAPFHAGWWRGGRLEGDSAGGDPEELLGHRQKLAVMGLASTAGGLGPQPANLSIDRARVPERGGHRSLRSIVQAVSLDGSNKSQRSHCFSRHSRNSGSGGGH